MGDVFGKEGYDLVGLGVDGFVIPSFDVSVKFFKALRVCELFHELVVHAEGEDVSKEWVDRVLREDLVKLV
jgi:hypothetical protein